MSKTPQEIGREFEEQFAEELGLKLVPGSGSQWHSKLDVKGKGARWSLKATRHRSYSLSCDDLEELAVACYGLDGDGSLPLMAIRLYAEDDPVEVVVMLKDDFLPIVRGEYTLAQETKVNARRRLANTPELLRDQEEDD